MGWKKRLEFTRDVHLATLHHDLQHTRKDLVCSQCGHYHGEIWGTARKMFLTVVSRAVVQNGGNQVKVLPVCDWCARKNDQAMTYEKSLVKASQLKESLRLKELRKYYPKGIMPRVRQKMSA
jgi:hypothetical protein